MNKQINDLRAKYNANGNAIIPNTFQHPNIFVDRLMHYLTPSENVVLTFAVRRILGFQDNIMSRKDNISLSQFTDGITAEDGHSLSNGCGLGTAAVRDALEALEKYKILMPTTTKPDPRKGQEYWLQENEHAIDWDGLEQREAEERDKSLRRTESARYAVQQKGAVQQQARGDVQQKARVLSNSNTKPTETHGNPSNTEGASAAPKPPRANQIPEIVLYREVTGQYPAKASMETVLLGVTKVQKRIGRVALAEDLLPFYRAWCDKGYNPRAVTWLSEWAVIGSVPTNGAKPTNRDRTMGYLQDWMAKDV